MTRSALWKVHEFLLTPLREGRPANAEETNSKFEFLLTPLREGRHSDRVPCSLLVKLFLLTPLREGRLHHAGLQLCQGQISTHAPAGGATLAERGLELNQKFLLTPLREGRRQPSTRGRLRASNFYSRPQSLKHI